MHLILKINDQKPFRMGKKSLLTDTGENVQKWTRIFSTRRSDASEKREENSASTFGQIRLWTSFESSPVSVKTSFWWAFFSNLKSLKDASEDTEIVRTSRNMSSITSGILRFRVSWMNEWLSLVPGFNIYALKGAGAMRSTLASSEPSHNRDSCH